MTNPGADSSDDDESESESASEAMSTIEKMRILGLGQRDLRMSTGVETLNDVNTRQLAYALSGTYRWVLPSDMLELGGELVPRLSVSKSMCSI